MENIQDRYLAYMLRLWQVDGESPVWRASLEDARTGERYGFGNLDLLFQFLTEQVGRSSDVNAHKEPHTARRSDTFRKPF
ncbi:MAG: hypothetical protein M1546_20900 [Chloroflexi bacterium]|nr:hypothetical protein [Chloroflexota bacterium]